MKKSILLVLALFIVFVSHAQRMKVTDEPLDKVVLAVDLDGLAMANLELQKELNLSKEQYKQVQLLNTRRYQQLQEAENLYKENALQRSKAVYSINLEADKEVSLLLQPEQMLLFLELGGRHQNKLATEGDD